MMTTEPKEIIVSPLILTGAGVSADIGSFVALEIADEKRAFETARRIAETTGREVIIRDANWVELLTISGGKRRNPSTRDVAAAKPNRLGRTRSGVDVGARRGWTGEVLDINLTDQQQRTFEELNLKPGDVCRLTK